MLWVIFFDSFQFERQKKEREIKKKQEALTLEETKEQIAQLETKLADHKEEKHQVRKDYNRFQKMAVNKIMKARHHHQPT